MKRRILIGLALSCILIMLYGSTFGPTLLLYPILDDPYLPYGTIAAWLALVSFAALPLLTSSATRNAEGLFFLILRNLTFIGIALAFIWPFIGRLLAGNWNYNFSPRKEFVGSPEASYWFTRYTGLILLLALVAFLFLLGYLIYSRISETRRGKIKIRGEK